MIMERFSVILYLKMLSTLSNPLCSVPTIFPEDCMYIYTSLLLCWRKVPKSNQYNLQHAFTGLLWHVAVRELMNVLRAIYASQN